MNKKFIKATEERCNFEHHIPAPYFRKGFTLDFIPENAEISICGLGFYKLFVNGTEITKGPLAPYISNPDHYCYYDTYDLTSLLKKGKNALGIILGNGFYNQFGGAIWEFEKTPWIGVPRVALEFSASAADKSLEFTADESFKVHSSPIIFDDFRMGEYYDANKEIKGWCDADFDDSGWKNALIAEAPRGEMKKCTAEAITVTEKIKPVKITKSKNGYIYDFGVNNAGVCLLKIKADKDTEITLRHSEMLFPDGELDQYSVGFERPGYEYYREYNQKDIFISNGEPAEYIPSFTYHGFRYVEVCGITEKQATESLLTYYVMSSDIKTTASFNCSDDTVNKLYEMVNRSDRANFYYFPTDCPHREKNGWTGDASLSSDHMVIMHDVSASFKEWLHNIRKSQNQEGALPGIVPTGGWGFDWGNGPTWDSVLFNLPYMLYKYRGDKDVIKENAHAMVRYLEYVIKRRSEDGTVAIGLCEWCPPGMENGDYTLPLAFSDSTMVMDMAKKAEEMFTAIEYTHQAEFARGIYKDMRNTIRRELIDLKTRTVAGECQSGQAIALYYGLFEKEEEADAFNKLLEYIHAKNDSFDCGFIGMHTIFHVLSDNGCGDLAYKMITKKDFPSYAYCIEKGETTLPEHFWSWEDNPTRSRQVSHNHHFFGDIGRWFITRLAGLCIVNSEYIEIKPDFVSAISFAEASAELPSGTASVSWKRENDGIQVVVSMPKNVKYSFTAPKGFKEKITVTEK